VFFQDAGSADCEEALRYQPGIISILLLMPLANSQPVSMPSGCIHRGGPIPAAEGDGGPYLRSLVCWAFGGVEGARGAESCATQHGEKGDSAGSALETVDGVS
jgi:hypothetical protein